MSFVYTGAKEKFANGGLDWDTQDFRVLLVMSNTTADTDQDALTMSGISTLDEYDGSGYSQATLAGEAVNRDDANNRAELDATDFNFGSAVSAGSRNAVGMVVKRYVDGTPANDIPVAYIDTGGFPFNGNGGAINVTINAEGLLQLT